MVSIAHLSLARVPASSPLHVLFEGRHAWPVKSRGYLRSSLSIPGSWLESQQRAPRPVELPLRDYPDSVLTSRDQIRPFGQGAHHLVVSARNCLNEFGGQVRIDGGWFRRAGDAPVPEAWPVLQATDSGARVVSCREAEQDSGDIVTGVPLVTGPGQPVTEDFLLANCSDVAHSFAVHPQGLFGPPPPAWQELSNAFVAGKSAGLADGEIARQLRGVASDHGAKRSDRLLHSVVGSLPDGSLLFVAGTGSLLSIGRLLAYSFQVTAAIVLENSGSVGWAYRAPGDQKEKLLVGAANQRAAGTVFLAFDAGAFINTFTHPLLAAE